MANYDSEMPDLAEVAAYNAETGSEEEDDDDEVHTEDEYNRRLDMSEVDDDDEEDKEEEDENDDEESEDDQAPPSQAPDFAHSLAAALPPFHSTTQPTWANPPAQPEETYGYQPPPHLPLAFKRNTARIGRPRLTPHERARREAKRELKRAAERAKRIVIRHENTYSKPKRKEVLLYLLTQRVEVKDGERMPPRTREGVAIGKPDKAPGPGEELIRYRPVSFDDASQKWRIPISTVQNWWRKREKILGKDCPELNAELKYYEVVPLREGSNGGGGFINSFPPPRKDVVKLGVLPGVQAYLWELGCEGTWAPG